MGFLNRNNTLFVIPGLLLCLGGLFLLQWSPMTAEGQTAPDASQDSEKKNADPNTNTSSDPNTTEPEDNSENDIFEVKLSSLVLINEAYDRIFTPELVTEDGLVKYSTLKRKRWDINAAKKELKQLSPAILMKISKEEKIAFWINTYNFCTIQLILDKYPIKPKWFMIIYPDNSIMQITGAWEKEYFDIQREEYNLQEIEQNLLNRYKDPRICFALSNASIGGATLRNEPYTAERLDDQLNDQLIKYLDTFKGMRWDKDDDILYLSNLFQVHKKTFLASDYATIKKFRNRKDEDRTWLNFILPYLTEEEIRYLETIQPAIKFIEFDWHLNEAK